MEWGGLASSWRRFSEKTSETVNYAVGELRENANVTADIVRDLSQEAVASARPSVTAASSAFRNAADTASSWITGDPIPEALPATTSSSSSSSVPRGAPGWNPPPEFRAPAAPKKPPTWQDLRKGHPVYRKGLPAEIVKVENEVDPPAFVVRMRDSGNEVGTDGKNLSLGLSVSAECLTDGVCVCLVGLQNRTELNGLHGQVAGYRSDLSRWGVTLPCRDNESVHVRQSNISVLLVQDPELLKKSDLQAAATQPTEDEEACMEEADDKQGHHSKPMLGQPVAPLQPNLSDEVEASPEPQLDPSSAERAEFRPASPGSGVAASSAGTTETSPEGAAPSAQPAPEEARQEGREREDGGSCVVKEDPANSELSTESSVTAPPQ